MDIKTEVRKRIVDLTRFAYEQGYRDGAQAALAEIETIGAEGVAEQLESVPTPHKAIAETKQARAKPAKPAAKQRAGKKKQAAKPKVATANVKKAKPKSVVVQEAVSTLLTDKGETNRDEVLKAAQAVNPTITKFDLGNGIRNSVKRGAVRVATDDPSRLLPSIDGAAPEAGQDQPNA